jgi:hypothetical protein
MQRGPRAMRMRAWCALALATGSPWPAIPKLDPIATDQGNRDVRNRDVGLLDDMLISKRESAPSLPTDFGDHPGLEMAMVEQKALTREAADPQKKIALSQVDTMMRAAQESIRALKESVEGTKQRTQQAMSTLIKKKEMVMRQKKAHHAQLKMYSAEAKNANDVHKFDVSLMQNMEDATRMEKQLGQTFDQRSTLMKKYSAEENVIETEETVYEYLLTLNGTEANHYRDEGSVGEIQSKIDIMFFRSEETTEGANTVMRLIKDTAVRVTSLQDEMKKAQQIYLVLYETWATNHMVGVIDKETEEGITAEKNQEEYGGLYVSGIQRPSLLDISSNVSQVESAAGNATHLAAPLTASARMPDENRD